VEVLAFVVTRTQAPRPWCKFASVRLTSK
jgi:hypothetical protein